MKKIFIIIAVMTSFIACNKETIVNNTDDNASLAFSVSTNMIENAITYANIANTDEWVINSIDVYVFDDNGIFKGKLTETTDYTKTENNNITTIKMSPDWIENNLGLTLKFYFVANDIAGDKGSDGAPHIVDFTGTEMDFKLLQTATGPENKYPKPPLLFSGVSSQITITNGNIRENLKIKRREARFDIVNTIETRFIIDRILINRAPARTYIFNDDLFSTMFYGTYDIHGPFNYVTKNNETISEGVFYLYPTTNYSTQLAIEASLDGGPEKMYQIPILGTIEPNKRYKLIIKRMDVTARVTFDIVTADYDEGETVNLVPTEEYPIEIVPKILHDDPVEFINNIVYYNEKISGTFQMGVLSTGGVNFEINYLAGTISDFTTPVSVVLTEEQDSDSNITNSLFDITIPQSDIDGPFDIEIKFISKTDETNSASLRLKNAISSSLP